MKIGDVNRLVVFKGDYDSQEDFENKLKRAIMTLLENEYIMTVRYDDAGLGIVCIDYNYEDESYGGHYPRWLSPDEYDSVVFDKEMSS